MQKFKRFTLLALCFMITFAKHLSYIQENGLNEEFKPLGSYNKDFSGLEVTFSGRIEEKVGLEVSAGIQIINTVFVGVDLSAGLYTEVEMGINSAIDSEPKFDINLSVESGIFLSLKIVAEIELLDTEYEHSFFDFKWPLVAEEKTIVKDFSTSNDDTELSTGENEKNGEFNSDSGFTMTAEKNRLEQNSCVNETEDESYYKYKFNYKNGKFEDIDVTMVFYIDTGYAPVDSLVKSVVKLGSIYLIVKENVFASYAENGNYAYLSFKVDKEMFEEAYGDVATDDYYSFKIKMQENGFICK